MAKALVGFVGSSDLRLSAEVRRLQLRIKELEAELAELRAAHQIAVSDELLTLPEPEFA